MKDKKYTLNTVLTAVFGLELLVMMLIHVFAPRIILPQFDLIHLVTVSPAALVIDHYLAPGAKRCWICIPLFSFLTFCILPWASGLVPMVDLDALWLGLTGCAVFTAAVKHLLKELAEGREANLKDLLLEPVFIPKSMKLHAIMDEFRRRRTHMAVVADEYGGISGIVTMEDVLEQLVGEIWDENDDIVNDWQELGRDRYECAGDLNLSDFFDHLDLDDEEVDTDCATVGGWATENIGAMPVPFDAFDYKNYTILVKEVEDNRIERLIILEHHFEPEE